MLSSKQTAIGEDFMSTPPSPAKQETNFEPEFQLPSAYEVAKRTRWLTANEAAEYLKVKPRTVLKWAKEARIPAHALSGCKRVTWRFLKSELDNAMLSPPSAAGSGRTHEQQKI
jgi:excisionase family DNA binding protein